MLIMMDMINKMITLSHNDVIKYAYDVCRILGSQ